MGRKSFASAHRRAALLVAAGALVASCSGSPAPAPSPIPTPSTSTLRGTITTREGPLQSAFVEVLDGANRGLVVGTSANGTYTMPGVTRGMFGIRASFPDYLAEEMRITLTADQTQDFRLTRPVLQYFDTLIVEEIPGHQYRFRGSIRNDGDACAQQIRGTVTLTFNQVAVLSSSWTLEPSRILRPQEVATYEICCLADRYAGQSGIYTGTFEYVALGC